MKKLIVASFLALGMYGVNAQEQQPSQVQEGTVLEIAKPAGSEYQHINFPKKNIIIKRGGIASDKLVYGEKVVVTQVTQKKDGTTQIRIKPVDGTRFYRALRSVTVDYDQAIAAGELTK
ncbi:hypothetical protein SAMN05216480_11940 [Pustulibacterium marinum]|uniref:Uncharacterized protein n=1 Tax=Pustulibacterium marinum TaxID=1224947 RepID=A0A1I7IQI6_9FLAO|nr:hypothetical protein [Pustulibacterium marinum]SFU75168.1 hypothetical protein SAMN05216480_11940 [Pustulibacterium marinum]